jgi:hypothetical protein
MLDKSLILHLYNRLFYGKKKFEYSVFEFREGLHKLEPVIFLSTGRCGTKWLTERLEGSRNYVPIHNPRPLLRVQGKLMHQYDFNSIDQETFHLLSEIFLAGREEIFTLAGRAGKELAITDSRGTFFAYIIADLFPKAKFVFVHRHPFEVIRSGLKRGWYVLENESELNRILPNPDDPAYKNWELFSQTQKIAWLWAETNRWIVEFLSAIPDERKHVIGFNNWNADTLSELFNFMNAGVSDKEIIKNLNVKSNAQKANMNPAHKRWTEENESEALQICGDMAQKLNYLL